MEARIRTVEGEPAYADMLAILRAGDAFPLRVTGSSMKPFLKDGRDTVWLRGTQDVRRGEIVFFRRDDGTFILHRVRSVGKDGTLTVNGDAQSWCETVRPEQIVAKAEMISYKGKEAVSARKVGLRLRDALWYPTRPIRPFLFRAAGCVKRVFRRS